MSTPTSPLREMTAHNNLHSLLFQTTSAEYIALCVQTYQLARHAVRERLAEGTHRNPAIVFDLDETVLDNSPFQRWLIKSGSNFDEKTNWRSWSMAGKAGAVPGAVEFIKFITGLKDTPVQPLFITSRENVTRKGTAQNLYNLGILSEEELKREIGYDSLDEAAKVAHSRHTRLFMKGMPKFKGSDGKEYNLDIKFDQRVFCERVLDYEILLSIGDNLGDYAEYYGRMLDKDGKKSDGHPTVQGRRAAVWQDIRLFGREFILIPNATYGSWLRALEGNGIGASDELAQSANPVRQGLSEPTSEFIYDEGKKANADSAKLDAIPDTWAP
jgi:predicted secreted acid phosphatase